MSGASGDGSEGVGERMGATGVGAVQARRSGGGQWDCGSCPAHTPTSGAARQWRRHATHVGPHSCHCTGRVWCGDPLRAGQARHRAFDFCSQWRLAAVLLAVHEPSRHAPPPPRPRHTPIGVHL